MLFCCAQVRPDQRFRQDVHFLASVFRDFAFLRRVCKDQFFFHCILQRLIQHHMNALHHARTQPVFFQLRLVFLLHATTLKQFVVKLLDLQHRQLFQLHISELRNDVMIDGVVVKLSGRVSHLRVDVNGVPQLQPLFERITSSLHRIELLAVLNGRTQFIFDFCLRLAKHIFRDRLSVCIIARRISAFPASVFPLTDITFAIGSSFRHRVYLLNAMLALFLRSKKSLKRSLLLMLPRKNFQLFVPCST